MRDGQTQVRIKLHITNTDNVQNLWMCLNYDQKPTIGHIIEHVKQNYVQKLNAQNETSKKAHDSQVNDNREHQVKLFLDDFWLPPHENSRLIRENDCIKVDFKEVEIVPETDKNKSSIKTNNQYDMDLKLSNNNPYKQSYANNQTENVNKPSYAYNMSDLQQQAAYYANYYNKTPEYDQYIKNLDAYYQTNKNTNTLNGTNNQTVDNNTSQQNNNKNANENKVTNNPTTSKNASNPTASKNTKKQQPKEVANCYKKFAVGSFVHMLNEPVTNDKANKNNKSGNESEDLSEEQLIDDYYHSLQLDSNVNTNKKNQKNQNKKQDNNTNTGVKKTNLTNEAVSKIASSVIASGQQKWKNSNKPANTSNGPKHIRFPSSDSSDSSSTSSSSSSSTSDEEEEIKKNQKQAPKQQQQKQTNVKNPKTLNEFKKVFNDTKLNAPKPENFTENANEVNKKQNDEQVKSPNKNRSPKSPSNSPRRRRSPSPKVDYEKFDALMGAPNVNDKIAFQILEISSSFTPEISGYKKGIVVAYDESTQELTIELKSTYNSVLNRPNKFTVIEETEDDEVEKLKKEENIKLENEHADQEPNTEEQQQQTLQVDWRNLMNVKLLPVDYQL